jgi:hypothetical protein
MGYLQKTWCKKNLKVMLSQGEQISIPVHWTTYAPGKEDKALVVHFCND